MSRTITIRLPKDLADWLEDAAKRNGVSQGRLIRDELEKLRKVHTAKPFMRFAGVIKGGPKNLSSRKGFSTS